MSTIECIGFKSHVSGALQGFANLRVPKMGIEVFGCSIFVKEGRRWMSMPSREYLDRDTGEKKYISTFRFMEKQHQDSFCKAALQAIDFWREQNPEPEPEASQLPNLRTGAEIKEMHANEIPF